MVRLMLLKSTVCFGLTGLGAVKWCVCVWEGTEEGRGNRPTKD